MLPPPYQPLPVFHPPERRLRFSRPLRDCDPRRVVDRHSRRDGFILGLGCVSISFAKLQETLTRSSMNSFPHASKSAGSAMCRSGSDLMWSPMLVLISLSMDIGVREISSC